MTLSPSRLVALAALALTVPAFANESKVLPSDAFIEVVEVLSADEMGGRAPGTTGNKKSRTYLLERITQLDIAPTGSGYEHSFGRVGKSPSGEEQVLADGINLLFEIDGRSDSDDTIVITAHYDHVGVFRGEIYNGADDNASGVAGVLAIADHFSRNPPENKIVFALLDAEETGLAGAWAFVRDYADIENVTLNINLDMISRSDKGELYAAGTYHQPQLVPVFEKLAKDVPVTLLIGHDDPALGPYNDWTKLSDHYPFHHNGIPFIYFGVEDHPDYHKPGDDFDKIPLEFFSGALQTVVMAAEALDEQLGELFP